MIRVIINADDLGKDPIVNETIAFFLSKGLITSSTILANSTVWDQVHSVVDKNPQASFGVHLNLTEGKALTHSSVLLKYGVVNTENVFTKKIQQIKEYDQDLIEAVFDEWAAQVEKVQYGEKISVSHLDGHHHVHTIPELETALLRIIDKYNIRAVRRNYSLPVSCMKEYYGVIRSILQGKGNTMRWNKRIKSKSVTTDFFSSYEACVDYLKQKRTFPKDGSIELMCHPGHSRYVKESELIINKILENFLPNIELINYNTL